MQIAVVGVVVRGHGNRRRVEISRLVRHPKYGKVLRRKTVCCADDKQGISKLGDAVELRASRPLSRSVRWTVERVLAK